MANPNDEKDNSLENEAAEKPGRHDATQELNDKITELTSGWQRTQADFMNYKKQVEQDRARLVKFANAETIESLLPILDNFALASKHIPPELESNSWVEGIKQIEKQFESILFSQGLEKITAVGQQFNPEIHEAMEQVESDQPEHTVVEEISPGYKLNGIILRPARVKVSKGNS